MIMRSHAAPGYAIAAVMVSLLCSAPAVAQRDSPKPAEASHEREGHHEDLSIARPAFELMISEVFQTASVVVPVWNRVATEVHFFGLPDFDPSVSVVQAAIGYQLPLGRFGFIAPGVGYYWGKERSGPSASLRWQVEVGRVVSEGLLVEGFRATDGRERAQIWDGNHVSLTMFDRRLEVGPTWEHIHVREENEWKWGARVAARVHENVTLLVYAMTPGKTEWRVGFAVR